MVTSSYFLKDAMISGRFSSREISRSELLTRTTWVINFKPVSVGGGVLIGPTGLGLAERRRRDMLISDSVPTAA